MKVDQLNNGDFQWKKAQSHGDYFQGEKRELNNFRGFTDLSFVSVSCCCCNKQPHTEGLQTTQQQCVVLIMKIAMPYTTNKG